MCRSALVSFVNLFDVASSYEQSTFTVRFPISDVYSSAVRHLGVKIELGAPRIIYWKSLVHIFIS